MNLRVRARSIPELRGESFQVAPLSGGLSNHSFLLSGDFGRWVLRINEDVAGVDRERERRVLGAIADEAWAPSVIRNAVDEGYMLYEYRDGPTWSREAARAPGGQRAIGAWLRQVHAKPASSVPVVDAVDALEGYLNHLPATQAEPLRREAAPVIEAWNGGGGRFSEALCHLDLVAANILGDGHVGGVIDWEFAGRAEPALDLAFYLHYHALTIRDGEPLLDAYGARDTLRDRVAVAIGLVSLLDRAWCQHLEQREGQRSKSNGAEPPAPAPS